MFTNVDRTVHLSDKAVEPPGQARPALDIFLDYARHMDFRDLDGNPFPQWTDASSAFDVWTASTTGRPCDYTGLSHAKLRETPSGIQWPCNAENPEAPSARGDMHANHTPRSRCGRVRGARLELAKDVDLLGERDAQLLGDIDAVWLTIMKRVSHQSNIVRRWP